MKKTTEKFRERIEKKIKVEFNDDNTNSPDVWEFWWYYEGMNVWNEISKDGANMRVCLILQTRLWNDLLFIAPITTKNRLADQLYYQSISNFERYWLKTPQIIINQCKLVDKKRLFSKLSKNKISVWFVNKIIDQFYNLVKWKNL